MTGGDVLITYDKLLVEADNNNLIVKEKPLRANKGRIKGNRIAIKQDLTETDKKCVLAEELGHYYTSVGNIVNQSTIANRKLEMLGRINAYERLVGLSDLIAVYNKHCQSIGEAAEFLEVTENFLLDAFAYYRRKYGLKTQHDGYIICFEPFQVLR